VFAQAGAAEVWARNADFAVEANHVAHGGRLVDLRTPGATYPEVYLPVHGAHQGDNASLALAAAEAFFGRPLAAEVVEAAFAGLTLPGRLEVLSRQPLILLDGAHNPAGARALAAALTEEFDPDASRVVVLGMLAPRDPAEMLEALGVRPSATRVVVACAPPSPRALPAAKVAAAAMGLGVRGEVAASVSEALEMARGEAQETDMVLVTGSLYLVGAARALLGGRGANY